MSGRILKKDEDQNAPKEVFVEFSAWPDGTFEVEDMVDDEKCAQPHWVRYVRADVCYNEEGQADE